MYLGKAEILRRIKEAKLLEDSDIDNVQGSGVDLQIDSLLELRSEAHLGVEERRLPEMEEMDDDTYTLKPGGYYLCVTKEKVNMPPDLVAFMLPRSTLFRCGVSLRTAVIDPGYCGVLTIGMKNESEHEFTLQKGARVCQVVFSEIRGESENYNGRYQGGKVK